MVTYKISWPKKSEFISALFHVSTLVLVVTNGVTIYFSWSRKADISLMIWVYWLQSVFIGFFQVLKILLAKRFTTDGLEENGRQLKTTEDTPKAVAMFFGIHYGIFHVVYLLFLLGRFVPENTGLFVFLGMAFFLNHLFSFVTNIGDEMKIKQNLGNLMFSPYVRIIPMHLIMGVAALVSGFVQPVFLLIRGIVDIISHVVFHASQQRKVARG